MKIGLVASEQGVTVEQEQVFVRLMLLYRQKYGTVVLCHGDTKGGEEKLHGIALARELCSSVEVYPPADENLSAGIDAGGGRSGIPVRRNPARPHHLRYQQIVDNCDAVMAFPTSGGEAEDDVWRTVRYCKTRGRPVMTVIPDGTATRWPAAGNKSGR